MNRTNITFDIPNNNLLYSKPILFFFSGNNVFIYLLHCKTCFYLFFFL